MNRMLEYLRLWWKMYLLSKHLGRILTQQEKIMILMSDVVTLATGVSAKLDTLLAQAPVATQDQVDAVAAALAHMDAALTPPAPPAA